MRVVYALAPLLLLLIWAGAPDSSAESVETKPGTPETPSPTPFDPRVVRLPEVAPELGARELIRQQEYGAAADLLEAALAVASDGQSRGRLRFMLGEAQEKRGRRAEAKVTFGLLASAEHPLSNRAQLALAELLCDDDPAQALQLLLPLREGYAFSRRAQLLAGMAYKASGKSEEAIAVLRGLLDSAPNDAAGAFAAVPLAELLAAKGGVENKLEAIALFQRVESRSPLSRHGRQAKLRREEVLSQLPPAQRRKAGVESTEDTFIRGEALMRAHAYDEATQLFERLSRSVASDRHLLCKADLQRGRALIKKRDRTSGAKVMGDLITRCADRDLKAWAHYYAGQALLRTNEPGKALAHYDALAKDMPEHRLADDGLFQGAIAAADADDREGMQRRLQQLVEQHPDGDMHREALFTLAWDARKRQDLAKALTYFDRLSSLSDRGEPEGMQGRASYWRARTLYELGRKDEALAGYESVVRSYPLSYHAQQALAHLHVLDRARCSALQAWLKPKDEQPLLFPERPVMNSPGFLAALSLLQIGDVPRAAQELEHLGLTSRKADAQDLWLVAALYDAAQAFPEASAIARGRLGGFLTEPPQGTDLRKWRIAYPKAFAPLVEQAAKEANVPAAYVRAVAREESAFDPQAVSSAHAYGLIQLMRPTARQYAEKLKLPSTPEALQDPETNLRIGSQFIHFLWQRYEDNPAIVPAAYNAGHGSVERWLRAAPNKPLDEWVESIPFGETRRYTRRVLQSYGTYAFLETGVFPPLKAKLPKRY